MPLNRAAPVLVALAVFAGLILLWFVAPGWYFALLSHAGFAPTHLPFNDTRAVLVAISCWRDGVNVYAPSPCMHGGVYNYSPFLLSLGALLHVPVSAGTVAGLVLDGLFLAALCWLPPVRSRAELVLRIAAICSGSVLFVLERGNLDAGMFVLAVLGMRLIEWDSIFGRAGYALFLLGAACKFYLAAVMIFLLRERMVRILLLAVPLLLALLVYMKRFGGGTLVAIRILPAGMPFNGVFGALNLPFGLWLFGATHTLHPTLAQFIAAVSYAWLPFGMQLCTAAGGLILIFAALRVAPAWMGAYQKLEEEQRLFLTGGAAVMLFCFFLAQNIEYRGIFLLLVLPGLCGLAEAGVAGMRVTCAAILFLLWQGACLGAVRALTAGLHGPTAEWGAFLFWLFCEFVWWGLIFVLTCTVVCFLRMRLLAWQTMAFTLQGRA